MRGWFKERTPNMQREETYTEILGMKWQRADNIEKGASKISDCLKGRGADQTPKTPNNNIKANHPYCK
jgi:hypothetical protein